MTATPDQIDQQLPGGDRQYPGHAGAGAAGHFRHQSGEGCAVIERATIQARRAALSDNKARSELDCARLDDQIAALQHRRALLSRNIDAMAGGLQELDALLEETPATPTNGAHPPKTGPVSPLVPGWP